MQGKQESKDYRGTTHFPIVAIGASAGGLQAMSELLQSIPVDIGMSFVYIQHLDLTSEGSLATVLQKDTKIKVSEVQEGTSIAVNQIFIIASGTHMVLNEGRFNLANTGSVVISSPIDCFFHSLAKNEKERSIAILLSGSSSEGCLGMKAVKEAGGFTLVQDESALFHDMPRSAIEEGVVDAILSPVEMARELQRLGKKQIHSGRLPNKEKGSAKVVGDVQLVQSEDLKKILRLVEDTTGVDFTNYKENIIQPRIIRRMLFHKLQNLSEYLDYLGKNEKEVKVLYQKLLINATSFFRDAEASSHLKNALLPELLKNKSINNPLRIWVPGCATGEEAYSLAITLCEILGETLPAKYVQIFATDVNERAIGKARAGTYKASQVSTISFKSLEQFFTNVDGEYRVVKKIRDLCIFATHNILKNPPFARVDLISCGNLLIYLKPDVKQKVLLSFHYSLNNRGFLILGKSETASSSANLFCPLNKQVKIFSKNAEIKSKPVIDFGQQSHETREQLLPKLKLSLPESLEAIIDNILLTQFAPAAVVVNYDLDILHFRGSTGLYLQSFVCNGHTNLLKTVRSGLEAKLRNATQKAIRTKEPVKIFDTDVTDKGSTYHIAFEVIPIIKLKNERFLLIVFEELKTSPVDLKMSSSKDRRINQLESELVILREEMRCLMEEQQAFNEELQLANQEVISGNQELKSINEELETSKEELEAVNQKLLKINRELQLRVNRLENPKKI